MVLQISQDQYANLEMAHRRRIVNEAIAFLADMFPHAAKEPEEEFQLAVSEQIERAIGRGLRTKRQIWVYLVAAWALGRDFDSAYPAAAETLGSDQVTADNKRRWLSHWLPKQIETVNTDAESL